VQLSGYKRKARLEGKDWDLPDSVMQLFEYPCVYGGEDPAVTGHLNGLDRVDNTKGYINGNVVPCCARHNREKNGSKWDRWMETLKIRGGSRGVLHPLFGQ